MTVHVPDRFKAALLGILHIFDAPILAMGLGLEQALGSLRLTTGYATTDDEIASASTIIRNLLTRTPARA